MVTTQQMLILPTGRKVPFSRNICKIFAALSRCWGDAEIYPWFTLQLLKTPPASPTQTVACMDGCFLLLVQAGLFCIVSSHLPSWHVQSVSSAPCRHMNHCSIAGAAKQLAPLLGQSSISSPQASVLFQQWFQGPHSPFQPLRAKLVFEK